MKWAWERRVLVMKYVVVGIPKTEFLVGDIPVWEDGLRRSRHTDRRKGGSREGQTVRQIDEKILK